MKMKMNVILPENSERSGEFSRIFLLNDIGVQKKMI
uniref:Uncharacterized protein n=1 Tax=viral metagenome TaxID=1070528 RepID=A0A6C0HUI1_9ZZZZ